MVTIEFFKQQAKNLLKDYKSGHFDENEGYYVFNPRFFVDLEDILMVFDVNEEDDLTLMQAQHIIARLSGFYKWTELIKASPAALELGQLLLTNRLSYQEKSGIITNLVESIIVEDWKMYEEQNLHDVDDESKLQVFKEIFLNDKKKTKKQVAPKYTFDFSMDSDAQDMLSKIMGEKNLPADKAILSSITQKNCLRVISTGWASIALSLWGHADPDGVREKLTNTRVEVKIDKAKMELLSLIMEHEEVNLYTAVMYCIIFQMEALGYHI